MAALTTAAAVVTPARADSSAHAIRAAVMREAAGSDVGPDDALKRFYELRGFRPAWTAASASVARQAMAQAADEGLNPSDYRPKPLSDRSGPGAVEDVEITRAFLRYVKDVHIGRLAPEQVYVEVSLPARSFDAAAEVNAALTAGNLSTFVAGLPPQRSEYAFLRSALAHYRALEASDAGKMPIRPGQKLSALTAAAREKLRLRLAADDPDVAAAGAHPSQTVLREALRRFQARFGLRQSGTLTPETVTILKQPISDRVLQIEANMERWRWLPSTPDARYIEVNAPDASLKVIDHGETILRSPVVVGEPDWATPILATTAQAVVINPPWHVPSDLAGEEILPHLIRDESYLASHNMVLVDGPAQDPHGRTIDWRKVPAEPFPYRIEQLPGPRSGLGALLLDMPNGFGVYLHDTPDQALFRRANRFLSHGCVRVQGIAAVASYALFGDPRRAGSMPHPPRTETQRVALEAPLPVYMLYWTVFRDEDGAIAFRRDAYGRDVRLIAALYGRGAALVEKLPGREKEDAVARAMAP